MVAILNFIKTQFLGDLPVCYIHIKLTENYKFGSSQSLSGYKHFFSSMLLLGLLFYLLTVFSSTDRTKSFSSSSFFSSLITDDVSFFDSFFLLNVNERPDFVEESSSAIFKTKILINILCRQQQRLLIQDILYIKEDY